MNDLEIKPEEQKLQSEGPRIVEEAESFKVVDDLTCEQAVTKANTIKTKKDWAVAFFLPMKKAAKAAHQAICDREGQVVDHLEKAQKLYIQKAADHQKKKEDEVREKERIAKEAAEKKEREERARLEEEARKKEAEETKKREEARKAQEKADKLASEGKAKQAAEAAAKAKKAKEEADAAEKAAEALHEKKENVYVAPKPVIQATKPAGMSVQTVWVPEIIDAKKVPLKWYGEIDLGRLKRSKTADPTLEVPGIRFIKKAQGAALGVGR